MYKIKDEVPAATAKALIVPFNILATLIAYGRLLDTGKFVKKSQFYLLFILIGYAIFVAVYVIATLIVMGVVYCKTDKKETAKHMLWFLFYLFTAFGVAAGYFAGDNITDAMTLDTEEDIDLTVISILILLGAKLGSYIIPYLVKCGKSSGETVYLTCSDCCDKNISWLEPSSPDNCSKCQDCPCRKDNPPNPIKFYELTFYALVLTIAIIQEIDITYKILQNFVSLTRNMCRTRKYNTLWGIYCGVLIIVIFEIAHGILEVINIYIKNKKNAEKKNQKQEVECGWIWVLYFIIVAGLAIIINAFFFVADNKLPLDCSSHFSMTTPSTNNPSRILTVPNKPNYELRVSFLVFSLAFSIILLVIGIANWSYFLYRYYNEPQKKNTTIN
ncbi:PREDICTED: uncharacterized protein LOC109592279 [Amphimedon queenslandica]|uniref:Uncharacterized protein n=1 Tax=Amphimedon queenslandica TaxID=400682 RepID=A0AAN0K227_AMPQE|nr:PREDICTED: uncharacterized protein LOC109592279 [Amphimedon queenslandica]|eukprot:XP_019863330.1 PREDICTED: uncharacterized protein LOC109592279 [Amphimedon queenslandica]